MSYEYVLQKAMCFDANLVELKLSQKVCVKCVHCDNNVVVNYSGQRSMFLGEPRKSFGQGTDLFYRLNK